MWQARPHRQLVGQVLCMVHGRAAVDACHSIYITRTLLQACKDTFGSLTAAPVA